MNAPKIKTIGASLLRTHPCNNYTANMPSLVRGVNGRTSTGHYINTRRRFLSSKKGKSKKPKLSKAGSGSVEALWCTSATTASTKPLEMGKFGLKRLDYTSMKPPVWTTPPHPPTKTTAERVVFPLSLVFVAGIALWVYMSPEEEDMTEYWKRVESGQILLDDDDDDDDEDDDEDEE